MTHSARFGLGKTIAAAFLIAAIAAGAASRAWATTVSGPGLVTLPYTTVSGIVGADTTGSIEDPMTGFGTLTSGSQAITLTGPGTTPINVSAQLSCQCSVPGYGWIYSQSTATGSVTVSYLSPPPGSGVPLDPSISATATIAAPSAYNAVASVNVAPEVGYYVEIVDSANPAAHSAVPIAVSASGGFTYSNNLPTYEEFASGSLESSFYVSGVLHDYVTGDATGGSLAPGPSSWTDNNTYTMYTNEVYTVTLLAAFNGGLYGDEGGGSMTLSAYVDPTFGFADASDASRYALVFSGLAPVPEPSTWAMMLIGFAGLEFAARRRIVAATAALNGQREISSVYFHKRRASYGETVSNSGFIDRNRGSALVISNGAVFGGHVRSAGEIGASLKDL